MGHAKELLKRALKTVALLGLALIVVLVILFGLSYMLLGDFSPCGNQLLHEYYSPDNARKVIVFERDCGATTGFTTQVSILEANETLDDKSSGNVLLIQGHPREVAPEIHWSSNKSVIIHQQSNGKVVKAESRLGWLDPITIMYE